MALLDYGGYGCIISPAIPCKQSSTINNRINMRIKTKKYISKLQKSYDTQYEYSMIHKLLSKIKTTIPNYQNYFVLDDIYRCNTKLKKKELIHNYNKCPILNTPHQITQLLLPNMGVDLHAFFTTELTVLDNRFIQYNNKLIELYVKAIIPMNKVGFYHNDLKLSNILVKDNYFRIIDFGLTNYFTYRHFSFNNPFNTVLLSREFINYYTKNTTQYTNHELILNYLADTAFTEQKHYSHIIEPILQIMQLDTIGPNTGNIHPLLFNYYIKCISTEIPYNTIIKQQKDIYIHNLDTVGFLSIYSYLYLIYYNQYNYTKEPRILTEIKHIYLKYMFTLDKISYKAFIQDINKLNLCF